jgi:hypothetical protein
MPLLAWLKARSASIVLGHLFLSLPELELDERKVRAFEQVYQSAARVGGGALLDYNCDYPKADFLRYLVDHKGILLHGSNSAGIDILLPKRQSDFNGTPMTAVFASGDGVWPIFFAILDDSRFRGSMRNGCFVTADGTGPDLRFYFFSLNREMLEQHPWTNGIVYVLPRAQFRQTSRGAVRFDEWASEEPVQPLARLQVSPEDFPFLPNVAGHDEKESIYASWLRYRQRQRRLSQQATISGSSVAR